ncbi:ACP S-malonyltransferase [Massilia niastensis]|uniref:ACP S-malonyltransferase n=1 Tax=Massilia niastensis TaxID=544911 RepID=UPI00036B81B9|nr:acyltransferase domain-containing protein [Massilia niastensis]
MTATLALLCPGQGAQHRGMFELARTDARASRLLADLIDEARLPQPLDEVLAQDALLFSNRLAQPLVVAATLANWTALGDALPAPAVVAGYSIGEVAAYGVAGALAPRDAVALARERARLMDACLQHTPAQALVAISGLPQGALRAALGQAGYDVAIETGEDSFIAGGRADRADALQHALQALGARASRLPVEVASHTPFMAGAVAPLVAELQACRFGNPQAPVLSGISAERIVRRDQAIDHLSRQLAQTILWKDCMDAIAEAGVTVALELGPGAGLARMLQARHPQIATRSVADFRSLAGVAAWLQRHVD